MRDRTVTTSIDPDRCIGCELCIRVCPSDTLSMQEGKAVVSGDQSLQCGHCMAVCPTGAVTVAALDNTGLEFNSFQIDSHWLPFAGFDTAQLIRLMASRRSCRNFTDRQIEPEVFEDLVKAGTTAPSGSNCQNWTFTVLSTRSAVMALGDRLGDFFRRINRIAGNIFIRKGLKLIGKPQVDDYFQNHYQTITQALEEWDRHQRDQLFHGATALIIVGATPGASCPAEDALLATQNILLAAHSMGLGTCLIGFAVSAMERDPTLKDAVDIPRDETVYAVIALGYPNEKYERLTGRKRFTLRFVEK